jgi:hypothetical protein
MDVAPDAYDDSVDVLRVPDLLPPAHPTFCPVVHCTAERGVDVDVVEADLLNGWVRQLHGAALQLRPLVKLGVELHGGPGGPRLTLTPEICQKYLIPLSNGATQRHEAVVGCRRLELGLPVAVDGLQPCWTLPSRPLPSGLRLGLPPSP